MPFEVTDNETGRIATFENKPSDLDLQEAFAIQQPTEQPSFRGAGEGGDFPEQLAQPETFTEAIKIGAQNITGESSKETLGSILNVITSPIETAKGLGSVAAGAVSKAIPEGRAKEFLEAKNVISKSDEETAGIVFNSLVEDYGGAQNLRNTIANKPLQASLDALLLARGVVSGTSKALTKSGLPRAGELIKFADPLHTTKAIARKIKPKRLTLGADEVLAVTTGTSPQIIREAFIGGTKFRNALRGKTTGKQIRDEAVESFNKIKLERDTAFNSAFRNLNMSQELNIGAVKNAVNNVKEKFGIVLNEKGKVIRSTIDKSEWNKVKDILGYIDEQGNIATDLTGSGFHKLKRFLDSTSKGMIDNKGKTTTGGKFALELRDSVTDELNRIPGYTEMNRNFSLKTKVMDDIDNVLKLRGKNVESSINKVVKSMDQNKDYAREVVDLLEQTSGTELTEMIAGLALNPKVPVGHLGRVLAGVGALGGAVGTGAGVISPWFMAVLSVGSPRLIGEFANAIGRAKRLGSRVTVPGLALSQIQKGVPNLTQQTPQGSQSALGGRTQ